MENILSDQFNVKKSEILSINKLLEKISIYTIFKCIIQKNFVLPINLINIFEISAKNNMKNIVSNQFKEKFCRLI